VRSAHPALLLLFLLLPLLAGAGSLVPRLVRDIDRTTYAASTSPRQSAYVGHGFFFTAFGNRELWVYDKIDDSFLRLLAAREIRQLIDSLYARSAARPAAGLSSKPKGIRIPGAEPTSASHRYLGPVFS